MTLPPLRILSAGSLRAALTAHVLGRHETAPELVFGPAGLLRARIERGEACDLFLSANLDHPKALAARRPGAEVTMFARNRIMAVARPELGLTQANLLDVLLRPEIRIGTSTPGADPGGDYAVALFDLAGRLRDGASTVLAARAKHLVGGAETPQPDAGSHPLAHFLVTGKVDLVLCYRTTALALPAGFAIVAPPPELEVIAEYGLVVLASEPARHEAAAAFAASLLSPTGRAVLARHGFMLPG